MSPELQNIDELEITADQVVIKDGKITAEDVNMLPLLKQIFKNECADDIAENIMDLLNYGDQVDFVSAIINKFGEKETNNIIDELFG